MQGSPRDCRPRRVERFLERMDSQASFPRLGPRVETLRKAPSGAVKAN